jgi:hypothetical protein
MRQLALAIPFVLGSLGTRAAAVPLGDAIARALVAIAPARAPARLTAPDPALDAEPDGTPEPERTTDPGAGRAPRRVASRLTRASRASLADTEVEDAAKGAPTPTPKGTIVIPPAAVTRALERKDVGATNAKGPDGAPIGARLRGVGKYGVGLRDGDIVISVQGTRTRTVEAMVQTAVAAATGGATRITGTILRGDSTYDVVLSVPRQ